MDPVRLDPHVPHANDNRALPDGVDRLPSLVAPMTDPDCFGQTYVETEVAWDATLIGERWDDPSPLRLVDGTW